MDGTAHDRRLASVQRSYAPTRLSDDTLTSVYERVFQIRFVVAEALEADGREPPDSDSPLLLLTGGQHG